VSDPIIEYKKEEQKLDIERKKKKGIAKNT
jgi:hypothetical protein